MSHRVRAAHGAKKIQSVFAAACTPPQKTPCAGLGPKELASADPTVDVGPASQAGIAGLGAERSEATPQIYGRQSLPYI